ncbi:hypothetical protein Tco_0739668 [Tanacetum coccineum]
MEGNDDGEGSGEKKIKYKVKIIDSDRDDVDPETRGLLHYPLILGAPVHSAQIDLSTLPSPSFLIVIRDEGTSINLILTRSYVNSGPLANSTWPALDRILNGLISILDRGNKLVKRLWGYIENFSQGQKEWDNPPNIISEQEIENLKVHAKRLFGNENVWVEMHRNIAWDKVENTNPQSNPQVPPSFEETTPHVTHPEEVDETIGISTEVEPLDYTKLEDIGLNTCSHDLFLSSKELPSVDELEPQPQPLPNCPPLDASLGTERGLKPPIKP